MRLPLGTHLLPLVTVADEPVSPNAIAHRVPHPIRHDTLVHCEWSRSE